MTQKEFEEKMKEVQDKFGIPDELCFKMEGEFKVDEDVKKISTKQLSLTKTAAAADFFTHALNTNIEKEMQILEAAVLDKGNYMYIVSSLRGIPSMQMITPVFKDADGKEIETAESEAEDFVLGKLMSAFAKATDSMGENGSVPNVLVREADAGEPYEKINAGGENGNGKDIFVDYVIQDLGKMSEKERYLAMHTNILFAKDRGVPRDRCFIVEVNDKDEAAAKLDEYMKEAGKEYIDCTFSRKDRKREKNDFVYGADGKNCMVNFVRGDEKKINCEPYESLDETLKEIVKSID